MKKIKTLLHQINYSIILPHRQIRTYFFIVCTSDCFKLSSSNCTPPLSIWKPFFALGAGTATLSPTSRGPVMLHSLKFTHLFSQSHSEQSPASPRLCRLPHRQVCWQPPPSVCCTYCSLPVSDVRQVGGDSDLMSASHPGDPAWWGPCGMAWWAEHGTDVTDILPGMRFVKCVTDFGNTKTNAEPG